MHNFGLALGKKGDLYATARGPRLPLLTDGSLLIVLAWQELGLIQHVAVFEFSWDIRETISN